MCHHIGDHNTAVKSGKWVTSSDFCFWNYPLIELAGKTIGFIGFGRIGQATAKIAQAFGLNVIVYNRSQNPDLISDTCKYVSLEEVFKKSDIISLHCPLTKEALDTGKVAMAAIDVTSVEPILADNPLLQAENCIITPHIAWAPKEARSRLMNTAIENLEAFLDGNPINVINS